MNEWIDLLTHGDFGASRLSTETLLFSLALSFLIGQFVGWVYMWTHNTLSYSQTFVASLVVLPVLICLMMILMTGSLMIAFGLLAVFAVVRFRNVLKDTRDTTFILWAIIEGMSVGTMRYSTALIGTLAIAVILLYLRTTSFGSRHRYDAVLNLQITGDLAGGVLTLKQVLRRHTSRRQIASERRLSDEGLNLSYRLLLRDPSRSGELQMELSNTEGLEQVSLFMREDESEI